MRNTPPLARPLALLLLAACGGGGAATAPDPGESPAFATLAVDPATGGVPVGGTLQLTATPLDAAGNPVAGLPAPQWQSGNGAVASVGADGVVTGVGAGTATITATLTSGATTRSATAEVTVSVPFAAVRLSHEDFTLAQGATAQLTATAVDGAGNPVPGAPAATWRSDAPAVATIAGGVVTGQAPGNTVITATVSHQGVAHSASVRVTVAAGSAPNTATVHGLEQGFSPVSVTIAAGGTVTWVMGDDEEHDVTWDGTAPPGGSIPRMEKNSSASRTFPAAGTYTYHCERHRGRAENGTVTVQPGGGSPPVFTSVSVAPSPASVAPGATVQLNATARDQNGNPMAGLPVATWQSSDAARATVSAGGLVTGVAAGSATITATIAHEGTSRSGTATVNVGTTGPPSTATVRTVDRTFSPRSVTIAVGGTVTWQFDATHNVTFIGQSPSGGNIPNVSSGSVARQFGNAGTYSYECTLHSGMTGSVVVQ